MPINGPMMRPLNAPAGWLCNTYLQHHEGGVKCQHYDIRGHIKETIIECRCINCLRKEEPGLLIDNPVQGHEDFPVSVLREKGLVGVFRFIEEERNEEKEKAEGKEENEGEESGGESLDEGEGGDGV